jgi:hypothetical protein
MRKFPPLMEGHWLVKETCPICTKRFSVGDETTLVPLYPADEENQAKAIAGRPYTAVAKLVHWTCWEEARTEDIP